MPICLIIKKNTSLYQLQKNTHLFAAILCAFGLGRRNFNTWDFSSAYICL